MAPGNALVHDLFTGLGILVAAGVFVLQKRYWKPDDRIWIVVAGALVGGALLGRLGTWVQHFDLRQNASLAEQWLYGNRSILSGLVGAYFGALLAKRLCGYRAKTGDMFAPAVAIGMAVGRVGCLLTELPGTPTGGGWGVTTWDGVPRHPSFAYEIAFQLAAFVVLLRLRGRVDLFATYLVGYAMFRFAVEFVRGNEVVFAGLTRPQLFLLALAPLAVWRIGRWVRNREDREARDDGKPELDPARAAEAG
ncbi:MAG TPA: prolipoprotein diacylglyceryl transferase family protein [Candidatus Limnocylindrales bacterium]